MQDIVIRRDVDGFGGFDGAIDVGLRNFAVFDFDNPLRIQAADMVTRDTGRNVADFGVRHQFGFIDCLLNGLGRRVNVGYHACFKAARRCLSESDDVDFVVVLYFANQGDDFGCADIEGTDIFTLLFHYICSLFRWSYNYLSVLAIVCASRRLLGFSRLKHFQTASLMCNARKIRLYTAYQRRITDFDFYATASAKFRRKVVSV